MSITKFEHNSIIKVLMERDGNTLEEAIKRFEDARASFFNGGEDPEEILHDDLGLEPDYLFDLMGPSIT